MTTGVALIPAADLAEQREKHLEEAERIKALLEAGKDMELGSLELRVTEFNRIFDEDYSLVRGSIKRPKTKAKVRKCTSCQQSGHDSRNCPTKGEAA